MKSFAPLESSPEVFNGFLNKLDISELEFTDIYSLDPELLAFVPRPVRAVLLVFPISKAYENYRDEADKSYVKQSEAVWSQQTIRNSCGTMAMLHALSNGVEPTHLGEGNGAKLICGFVAEDQDKRPVYLESSELLESLHSQVAQDGGSQPVEADAEVESHYVCLTKYKDELVELDGRRKGPIVRAKNVEDDDLLASSESLKAIQEFLQRESESAQFSMLALVDKN